MGWRDGAYARLWSADNKGNYSVVSMSISKKNKKTDAYETDFQHNFVSFCASAHSALAQLNLPTSEEVKNMSREQIRDRSRTVKISSCEHTNKYDATKKVTYNHYAVFGFEIPDDNNGGNRQTTQNAAKATTAKPAPAPQVPDDDEELPF